jgi:hypothetical protein
MINSVFPHNEKKYERRQATLIEMLATTATLRSVDKQCLDEEEKTIHN